MCNKRKGELWCFLNQNCYSHVHSPKGDLLSLWHWTLAFVHLLEAKKKRLVWLNSLVYRPFSNMSVNHQWQTVPPQAIGTVDGDPEKLVEEEVNPQASLRGSWFLKDWGVKLGKQASSAFKRKLRSINELTEVNFSILFSLHKQPSKQVRKLTLLWGVLNPTQTYPPFS